MAVKKGDEQVERVQCSGEYNSATTTRKSNGNKHNSSSSGTQSQPKIVWNLHCTHHHQTRTA
jgi:hypothetical protein